MTTWDDDANMPNKAGEAYMTLYNEEWRSTQTIQPTLEDVDAGVRFRGFLGDYNIQIKRDNKVLGSLQFNLDQDTTFDCIQDVILDILECFIQE